jgi:hypothetical protein
MLVVVVGGIALVTYEGVIVVAPTVAMFRDLWSALYHGR